MHLILYIVDVKQTLLYIKLTSNIISLTVVRGRQYNTVTPYIIVVFQHCLQILLQAFLDTANFWQDTSKNIILCSVLWMHVVNLA